ncbi:hypothetical protein AHAS_Ahas13G0067300 [Arachis hypogaea]
MVAIFREYKQQSETVGDIPLLQYLYIINDKLIDNVHSYAYMFIIAVEITTSYQCLSAKIYTNVVDVFSPQKNKARAFLLLNCILPLAIGLIVAPILKQTKTTSNDYHLGFVGILVSLLMPLLVPISFKIKSWHEKRENYTTNTNKDEVKESEKKEKEKYVLEKKLE